MSGWLTSTAGKLLKFIARAGQRNSKNRPERKPVNSTGPDSFSVGIHFEALEPRILLSGSGEAGLADNALQDNASLSQEVIEAESFTFDQPAQSSASNVLNTIGADEAVSELFSTFPSNSNQDGAPDALMATTFPAQDTDADATDTPSTSELLTHDLAGEEGNTLTTLDGLQHDASESGKRRELVLVDAGVTNYQPLVDDLLANPDDSREIDVFVLDSERDGISQISDVIAEYQDLDAVHIVSHGTDRAVKLGSTWLYGNNLDAHEAEISGWKDSLADGADLLFYGCDLAAGDEGRVLLATFGSLTGADVAASINDTGHSVYFGDWVLEYGSGNIETEIAFSSDVQQNWFNLMAVLTVDTTADVLDGTATSIGALLADKGPDGLISLREAIMATNGTVGADEIILPGGPSYTLSITGAEVVPSDTGDLDITDSLTITGAGAQTTTIDATGLNDRVFQVLAGATLNMSGVTITGGSAQSGGGILSQGTLSLVGSAIVSNTATGGAATGGGLYIGNTGLATLCRVEISGNNAVQGAGVYIDDSDINTTFTNVTLSGNIATNGGGGMYTANKATVTVINSTVAFNQGGSSAAGIRNFNGDVYLQNSILHNPGGSNASGTITSLDYNIDSDLTAGLSGPNDNTVAVDPLLGPLQINNGSTQTHELLGGSPAIDPAGLTGAPTVDQRGYTRDATPDVGAYEASGNPIGGFWMTTEADVSSPSGVKGLDSWVDGDVLQFGDPDIALEPGGTDGTLSLVFNVDNFAANAQIDALHYVTADITIGSNTTMDLQAGDVLFSTLLAETLSSTNSLSVEDADVVIFRPDVKGDYSSGTFTVLLEEF